MSDTWKEKLYEPSDELLSVNNVNYNGAEPQTDEEREELISIDHVDLSYGGTTGAIKALEDISFNIFPGEFICVLGPSG